MKTAHSDTNAKILVGAIARIQDILISMDCCLLEATRELDGTQVSADLDERARTRIKRSRWALKIIRRMVKWVFNESSQAPMLYDRHRFGRLSRYLSPKRIL